MKFACEHCGRLLSVADRQAGRKGRCPQCKRAVNIPVTAPEETAEPTVPAGSKATGGTKVSLRDSLLLDLPPVNAAEQARTAEAVKEKLKAVKAGYLLKEHEEPLQRPLPWIVDIFLYPLNRQALLILTLSTVIPFILRILLKFSYALALAFPPALILFVIMILIHWGSLLVFVLYINWYVVECLRDSAAGGIRAVDTSGSTPGVAELLGQALTSLICGAAYMAPAILHASAGGSGPVSWALCAVGGFVLPMALLAVTLFESLRALNPILLLGSILSTFPRYCLLAVFCGALCLLVPAAFRCLTGDLWHLGYALLFVAFYLLLVLAHIIGCFYRGSEERLNWDA
ncbi:MAG: hypothetical protein KBE65_15120 [Phycisphaerae bacterium]|nr:hypothetical protein [Phycisphaerae bacterium]